MRAERNAAMCVRTYIQAPERTAQLLKGNGGASLGAGGGIMMFVSARAKAASFMTVEDV